MVNISALILYFDNGSKDTQFNSKTAEDVYNALLNMGYAVRLLKVTKNNWQQAIQVPGNIVFNFVEDQPYVLYEKVARGLEKLGRGQFATNVQMFNYIANKDLVKQRLSKHNIPTPKYLIINSDDYVVKGMKYPLIVKPAGCHSAVGISQSSVVTNEKKLRKRVKYVKNNFHPKVIVEEFVVGREINVTVLGNGENAFTLPYSELVFDGECNKWQIDTYKTKWKDSCEGERTVLCPAQMSEYLTKKIEKIVLDAYNVLGFLDLARIDLRVTPSEDIYIFDTNPSPSISDLNTFDVNALNWDYNNFIEVLLGIAYQRVYGELPINAFFILQPFKQIGNVGIRRKIKFAILNNNFHELPSIKLNQCESG